MNVLVTGAKGFIGSALCYKLSPGNKIIGVDIAKTHDDRAKITWEQADLTDFNSAAAICEKYAPDVVIHCAGIAHQKIGAVSFDNYMRVNSEATENLAKAAAKSNPGVCFIFFSSVSVYGEGPHPGGIRSDKLNATRRDSVNLTRQAVTSEFHGAGINPQITQNRKDVSRPSTICRTYGVNKGAPVRSSGPTGQAKAQKNNNHGFGEGSECRPSSDY